MNYAPLPSKTDTQSTETLASSQGAGFSLTARHAESDCNIHHPDFLSFLVSIKGSGRSHWPSPGDLDLLWRPIVKTGEYLLRKGCLLQIFSINCHQNIGTTSRDSEMGPIAILMMTTITTQREDIIDFYWIKRDEIVCS